MRDRPVERSAIKYPVQAGTSAKIAAPISLLATIVLALAKPVVKIRALFLGAPEPLFSSWRFGI